VPNVSEEPGRDFGVREILLLSSGLLAACSVFCNAARAQAPPVPHNPPARTDAWTTEQVELVDGRTYQGLIESEDDAWVHLIEVRRPKARPMYLVIRPIERASIAKVVRLDSEQRTALRGHVEQFINRAEIEAAEMEAVRLDMIEKKGTRHQVYQGKWFSLEATTDAETTRRLIVRIEQIFTAYRQILPARVEPERPLRIVLYGSLEAYQAYLDSLGLKVGNRAVFLQQKNLMAAGSELGRYAAQLAELEARHEKLRKELKQLEEQLAERLRQLGDQLRRQGRPRSQIRKLLARERHSVGRQIDEKRDELAACSRENDRALDQVAGRTLTRLYHEAFHAYLENYVYPRRSHDVPPWLNEGLAMLFESALVESGSLRLGAPNGPALEALQADLKTGRPLPLARLLAADAGDFLVPAGAPTDSSNRYYAHAWGLVYYLIFEKQLLTAPALDAYLAASEDTTPGLARFEKLIDTSIPEFEKAWRRHILGLR
jgi:hypothetical protein